MEKRPNLNIESPLPVNEAGEVRKPKHTVLTPEQAEDLRNYIAKLYEDEKISNPVIESFKLQGYPLNFLITNMLNEGKEHQGGRKGSGFTQASRHLAGYLRHERNDLDTMIFDDGVRTSLEDQFDYGSGEKIDLRSKINIKKLHEALDSIETEEGRLIARMIVDMFDTPIDDQKETVLKAQENKIDLGTCTTSEVYFFHYFREGISSLSEGAEMNIIIDDSGNPIMIEKVNIGESHSAITLTECKINNVRIPKGSLVGIKYGKEVPKTRLDKAGFKINIQDCEGFEFLRFTTLAVSPENRKRAFGEHQEVYKQNGINGYDTLSIEEVAEQQKYRLNFYYI